MTRKDRVGRIRGPERREEAGKRDGGGHRGGLTWLKDDGEGPVNNDGTTPQIGNAVANSGSGLCAYRKRGGLER